MVRFFIALTCAMKRVTRNHGILDASNAARIDSLCDWIAENCDTSIGWGQLFEQSGFAHQELIALFQIHRHQTPMAYIKNVREQKKSLLPINPQANLFTSLNKIGSEKN
jgi:AraC-like DNA-binding protein